MDVNAALKEMMDSSLNYPSQLIAAINIQRWMARGGFAPDWGSTPGSYSRFRSIIG